MCGGWREETADTTGSSTRTAPWLRAALGAIRPDRLVTAVEPIGTGGRRTTIAVRFADAASVVVHRTTDATAAATEAALLSAVDAETAVPIAEPLGHGTVGDADPSVGCESGADGERAGSWLATRLVAGEDLHGRFVDLDLRDRRRIAGDFGRFLAELHAAFRFGGYGPIVARGDELRAARPTPDEDRSAAWRDWLRSRGRQSLDRLPELFDDVADAARKRLDAWTVEKPPVPRLFPWDLRPGNTLVADGEITAIVDWEAPLAAGAALSVAKAEYLLADWYVPAEAEALRRAFRAGYSDVRPIPTVGAAHRIVAVAEAAVDSYGRVTNPRYPPVGRSDAVAFHRRHLEDAARME